jgi:thioredoxin reductase/bacterioferritin-associated ferredoxin
MIRTFDLIVVGAGPAGSHAALTAAKAGLSVILFDEQPAAGGQLWRAPWPGFDPDKRSAERRDGDALRARLAASGIHLRFGRRVWSVGGDFRVDAIGPEGPEAATAPRLVAATGAQERVAPFPGWTLPGIVGLAGATALIKSHGLVPAAPTLVAGCGPLLLAVAAAVLDAGGRLAAIVDLDGPASWMRALPAVASRPDQCAVGLGWIAKVARARAPILFRHGLRAAEGHDGVESVFVGPVDQTGAPAPGPERRIAVGALVVGHGLAPGADIPRLLRAELRWDDLRGGHVPVLDLYGRTSRPGLYAAGDGAGVRGGAAAVETGRLAGLAAARDAGRLGARDFENAAAGAAAALARLGRFSGAMAARMAPRSGQYAGIPPASVVCRCEDVTRAEIDAAAAAGASDMNQLKHFTRCGMGPCQGRMCGEAAAALLAGAQGMDRAAVAPWTMRPPLRPVPLSGLVGDFAYSDIPIPKPAPL